MDLKIKYFKNTFSQQIYIMGGWHEDHKEDGHISSQEVNVLGDAEVGHFFGQDVKLVRAAHQDERRHECVHSRIVGDQDQQT